jgi:Ni/Fe-hydrogenase subunit HybB-like protein
MSADARARLDGAGYTAQTVTKAPQWHGLVAWDLLFNNLSTGLFLTAALGDLLAPETFTPLAKIAYPLALLLLVIDLACLVLDLGDPLRFHHMLRVFKPTSPMSLGTWCLVIYSFPLAVAAALGVLSAGGPVVEWVRKAAVVLGLLPALGSAAYKGVLLSTNAQPGWRDARWLGGYLTNSALTLGCAELLTLAALMGQERATAVLRPALVLLLVLNALVLLRLLAELRPALVHRFAPRQLWYFGLLALGGGMLAPLGLLLAGGSAAVVLAAVLLVLGSLAIRFGIIKIPHALSDRRPAAARPAPARRPARNP